MKVEKMSPELIQYFLGEYPVKLSKALQASLLDNHFLPYEFDYNDTDIRKVISTVYNRTEIDLDVSEYQLHSVPTRISNFQKIQKRGADIWYCKFDLVVVRRLADLDDFELEVIEERVRRIKEINDPLDVRGFERSYMKPMMKEKAFDFQYGDESSVELINEHFYEIIDMHKLSGNELKDLADYVSQREFQYILKPESETNIFNEATELRHEIVNDDKKLNLLKSKTNGREYLP